MLSYKRNHPQAHKRSCVKTLCKRVETHCSTPKAKEEELRNIKRQFSRNGHPSLIVQKTLRKRPAGSTGARPYIWQAIPYFANISETVARLLKPHGIGVAQRPVGTLRSRLMRIKDRIDQSEQSSIIYRAQCKDCSSNYAGQTSRKLATRVEDHRSAIRNRHVKTSLMASHCVDTGKWSKYLMKQIFSATPTAGRHA